MVHVAQDTGYELTTLRAAVRRVEGEQELLKGQIAARTNKATA
jgi:hypothetical protein